MSKPYIDSVPFRASWLGSRNNNAKKGSDSRSDILSWLAAEQHNQIIDPEMGRLLSELEDDNSLDDDQSANVREMRRT